MGYNKKAIVWELAVLDLNKNKYWCTGCILKGHHVFNYKNNSALKNALHVLKSYFIKAYANQEICIQTPTETVRTRTDSKGRFRVVTNVDLKKNIKITVPNSDNPLRIVQEYPIYFQEQQRTLDIISDIDDTILVSNTANVFKRIKTLLLLVPEKRAVIEFTKNVYFAWQDVKPRMFYISKSESNLFMLLTTFITHNNLPKGMLTLTPYSSFYQLLVEKKPLDFKLNAIRFLMTHTRSKQYILIGDDSQKDMAIYTDIVKEFPNLILKVYIRQTGKTSNSHQQKMWKALEATGVSASYFMPEHSEFILNEIKDLKQTLV